jgi:hypothetical protein
MNFINKLFWGVRCVVRPFDKATLAHTATLIFTPRFRSNSHIWQFNLNEREYIQYVNEPKVIVDKYFKKISK